VVESGRTGTEGSVEVRPLTPKSSSRFEGDIELAIEEGEFNVVNRVFISVLDRLRRHKVLVTAALGCVLLVVVVAMMAARSSVRRTSWRTGVGRSTLSSRASFRRILSWTRRIPLVATRDIGTAAARLLAEGGSGKRVIELAGPREYTPRDVAAAVERIVGKPIDVQQAPEEAMAPALMGAGMNAEWARLFQELTHGLNANIVVWEAVTRSGAERRTSRLSYRRSSANDRVGRAKGRPQNNTRGGNNCERRSRGKVYSA